MRDSQKNVTTKQEDYQQREELKFFFTPTDPPLPDEENVHAKESTRVPEVIDALREAFGEAILDEKHYAGEVTVFVERARIREICRYLRDEQAFDYLSDLGGVDRFTEEERFEVFYNIISIQRGKRIRLKVRVEEDKPVVPSIVPIYRTAGWQEREAYDMMGIRFEDHPDMRRMYMPEDFEYHPQRKEFPLLGVPGSLPLPPQVPEGELTMDPFAAARGRHPRRPTEEPRSDVHDS